MKGRLRRNIGISNFSSGSAKSAFQVLGTPEDSGFLDVSEDSATDASAAASRTVRPGCVFVRVTPSPACAAVSRTIASPRPVPETPVPDTRKKGEAVIAAELLRIPNEKVRAIAKEHLQEMHAGKRDFRF